LRRLAADEGTTVICDDRRAYPEVSWAGLPTLGLRPDQAAVVEKAVKVTQGFVVAPCGSGKTMCGLGVIARLRTSALVLVHTVDLAEQWRTRIKDFLGLETGLVGAGDETVKPISIALVQSLWRWSEEKVKALLEQFGLLIVDEAHHVAARTFSQIVDRAPARYRIGLTATPERADGLSALLELFLGNRLATLSHEELVAAGVLTLPTVRTVETDFTYVYSGPDDFARMLSALAEDEARNALVVDTIVGELQGGHLGLALSGRVEHCHKLAGDLTARGLTAEVLTGDVSRRERRAILEAARDRKLDVVVATTVADEGLDIPALTRVFLTFPSRSRGRTEQRLGRLMRPHPGKTGAVLVDFVDHRVPILRRHHLERRRLYAGVLKGHGVLDGREERP
jgi:superfamily II DNA or RNA helicase